VPDGWEGIAQQLDANRVFYTKRKIDEYKEYRDIIYGNTDGKKHEYRRYSILESKDYRQVPKTIQNVFLNSKMEAEFIKQTIILSLDNDVRIDLNEYAHELNDFETQLTDIRKFRMSSTVAQAENIAKLHVAIRNLERDKIRHARELSRAVNENERKKPEISERLKTQQEKETAVTTKLSRAKELFDDKTKKISGDIRVQEENLKKAKKLSEEYEQKNIKQIIARVEKKSDLEREKHSLENEKRLLSAQFTDMEIKYKAMFDSLDNRQNDFLNGKNAEKNKINAGLLVFQENTTKNLTKQIAYFKEEHKAEMELARSHWEDKKRIVGDLKIKREGVKHTRFFEKDIAGKEQEIQNLNNLFKQLPSEKENLQKQTETIQKQWELDEQNLQKDFDRNREKTNEQIAEIEKEIAEIESYINNGKDSLYGWLTTNYPDWEKTVGKVIDDKNVLFNPALNPRLVEKSNSLYGVEIDLSEINKTVKTVADYETEKSELSAQIQSLKKNLSALSIKLEDDREDLKKKYQPKIRKKKDEIRENEYRFEQSRIKHSEALVMLNELKNRARTELTNQLELIDTEIAKTEEDAKDAESGVGRLEEEQNKAIKAKEKECDKAISAEKERINALLVNIEAEIKVKNRDIEQQRKDIADRKNRELSEKGADTKRINEIDGKLLNVGNDLKFIEENYALAVEYRKDKRDFMDRISDFRQEKQKLEKQLETEQQKYEKQNTELSNELSDIQAIISELDSKLKTISEDLECFAEFKESDCFKSVTEYFAGQDNDTKTKKRVKALIDEIKSIHYEKLHDRRDDLRKTATDFLGKFSENNIFKFKKQIADDAEFLSFAEMLADFVGEQKIERIEKEVNERFALIVSTIGQETANLQAESGKIQSLVTKINSDFVERDFGKGIIKKIELKIEDSKNEIVQLLLMIKKFNDENSMDFGAPNLFSSDSQEKKNKDAVDLLKQFVKKINETKRDSVSLSDSFELKFRVVENRNDTGWVEKLSNVGSEGTDTLVKAMVNIMLLNVFKESVSKRFKDFRLHCMMDEIGKLHPNNVRGILKFANDRNILLINGSPIENDALAFTRIYKLHKDEKSITRVKRILTQFTKE
jgi:DNA repair exonuclease SbcCD ATPase subunit